MKYNYVECEDRSVCGDIYLLVRTPTGDKIVADYYKKYDEDYTDKKYYPNDEHIIDEVLYGDKGAREYLNALESVDEDAWKHYTIDLGWLIRKNAEALEKALDEGILPFEDKWRKQNEKSK